MYTNFPLHIPWVGNYNDFNIPKGENMENTSHKVVLLMTQITVFTTPDIFYKDLNTDFANFRNMLSKLSCSDAIFWCARINLALNATGNMEAQAPLFESLTTSRERYWLQKALRKNRREGTTNTIFFRGQMLELIRWIALFCHDHSDDGTTFNNEDTKITFFKCALIASNMWDRQTFGTALHDEVDTERIRQYMLASFRKSLEASRSAPDLSNTIGRGWIFYQQYFSKYYTSFNDDFLNITGLSFEDFLVCFSAIALHFMDPLRKPCIMNANTIGETMLIPDKIKAYIRLESQTLEELHKRLWNERRMKEISEETAGPINTIPLRNKPIYTASDGRSIVMDAIYFHESVLVSPMFLMIQFKRKSANQIFTAFGDAFEDYCCDILGRMYQADTDHILLRQKSYQRQGQNLEIDAALLQNKTAILFEIKASFIKESEVNPDGHSFEEELRKKYSNVVEGGQEKIKGVGQLSRTIKNIVTGSINSLNQDFEEINEIFPVLLVHDNLLDAPLTIDLLQKDFIHILEGDLGYDVMKCPIKIHALTVMTVSDLEMLENSVQHFNIIKMLRDMSSADPVSLHDFIAYSSHYGFYRNTHLLNASLEILEITRSQLFNQTE